MHMEPWDGPAGMVLTDGRYAVCTARPQRPAPGALGVTTDGLHHPRLRSRRVRTTSPSDVHGQGQARPGPDDRGRPRHRPAAATTTTSTPLKRARPYKQWLRQGMTYLHTELIDPALCDGRSTMPRVLGFQKLFQVTFEEREQVLRPLAETGQEAIGSMGDDTPMAVLSPARAAAVRLFPPAVRAGHQPADRPAARSHRDVAGDPDRPRAQRVRRRPGHARPRAC